MQLQNLLEILLISSRKIPGDGNPPVLGELEHEVVPFSHLLSGQIAAKWVVFLGVGTRLIKQYIAVTEGFEVFAEVLQPCLCIGEQSEVPPVGQVLNVLELEVFDDVRRSVAVVGVEVDDSDSVHLV